MRVVETSSDSVGRKVGRAIWWSIFSLFCLAVLAVVGVFVHGYLLADEAATAQRERVAALSRAPVPEGWVDPAVDPTTPETARLNELQFIGTHNSYVTEPSWIQLFIVDLIEPGMADTLRYSHPPLTEQLDDGVRAIEIDLRDHGDRFSVTHVPLVANTGTAPDFALALEELRIWSDAHPGHAPILVHLEPKEDYLFLDPSMVRFGRASFARIDEVIAEELGERVFTPAAFRELRVWPSLAELRSRFVFYFDDHEDAQERLGFGSDMVFVSARDGEAAFAVVNDPSSPEIEELAALGVVVRTRADADLETSSARRDRALESRAAIVSTDFPLGERAADGYVVEFPGGYLVRYWPPPPVEEAPPPA